MPCWEYLLEISDTLAELFTFPNFLLISFTLTFCDSWKLVNLKEMTILQRHYLVLFPSEIGQIRISLSFPTPTTMSCALSFYLPSSFLGKMREIDVRCSLCLLDFCMYLLSLSSSDVTSLGKEIITISLCWNA